MLENLHEDRSYDLFLALDERSYRYRLENLHEEKKKLISLFLQWIGDPYRICTD